MLKLKVAQKKTGAGRVPMVRHFSRPPVGYTGVDGSRQAGFPFYQLDRFLKLLVQDLHKHVAICEEFAKHPSHRIKSGGLLFDRRITRVITPGTLIDERFLDPLENNFLLAVNINSPIATPDPQNDDESLLEDENRDGDNISPTHVGLAWLDLSTGDFFTQSVPLTSLASSVSRIRPREIVMKAGSSEASKLALTSTFNEFRHLITYLPFGELPAHDHSMSEMADEVLSSAGSKELLQEEILACRIVLQYANSQLQGQMLKLQPPVRRQPPETMSIDKHSMRALEIKTTLREGHFRGSLLHAVRKTVTSSGSRLLNDWLSMS